MNFFVRLVGNNLMIFIPSTRNWSKNWVVHLYFFPCKSMDPTAEIIIFTYFFIVVMADFFFHFSIHTTHRKNLNFAIFFSLHLSFFVLFWLINDLIDCHMHTHTLTLFGTLFGWQFCLVIVVYICISFLFCLQCLSMALFVLNCTCHTLFSGYHVYS